MVALVAASALTAAACSSSGGDDAGAQPAGTTTMPPMAGMDHGTGAHGHGGADMGEAVAGSATGQSPCEKSGPPVSPGQTADEMSERGMVKQQPLAAEARWQLQAQQVQARSVVDKYPTVADAENAGYRRSTPYVPCIGAHYTNTGLVAKFDPAAPSELLYDGTEPTSRIVGLSYLVVNPGGAAPEGFAGPNDHWHQHSSNGGLCLKGQEVVGGEDSTPEQCAAKGGRKNALKDIYMLHDWVVPGFECTWGTFAGECPELGGKIGGSAWETSTPAQ
jgi:hypothetical protein